MLTSGPPLTRLPGGVWHAHDRLQSLQSLVSARLLAGDAKRAGQGRMGGRGGRHRQHLRQGASLGAWRPRGAREQGASPSRGGQTPKIHVFTNALGRLGVLLLTPGNAIDVTTAPAVLAEAPSRIRRLTPDKGCDADWLRTDLRGNDTFPARLPHGLGPSLLDPHVDYLLVRISEGCENFMALWRELREGGYLGTSRQVHRFVAERRTKSIRSGRKPRVQTIPVLGTPAVGQCLPSARQLAWLLVQATSALDAVAATVVARVEQDATASAFGNLARRFTALVRASEVGRASTQGRDAASELKVWITRRRSAPPQQSQRSPQGWTVTPRFGPPWPSPGAADRRKARSIG